MTGEVARQQVQVTKKVLEEIKEIRDTGQTNMLAHQDVMVIADSLGFFETVCWIEENPKDYRRGVLRGFRVKA